MRRLDELPKRPAIPDLLHANLCGTSVTRPALTQSCVDTSLSCALSDLSCYSCATNWSDDSTNHNRILAPSGGSRPGGVCLSTVSRPALCDGTNAIEDVTLSAGSLSYGQSLTVSVDYACYKDSSHNADDLTLWYFNGSAWKKLKTWTSASGNLPGCSSAPPTWPSPLISPLPVSAKSGTVSWTFTPDRVKGTHYVRAFEDSTGASSGDTPCPTTMSWGNIDDHGFTVTNSGGGGGGPRKIPTE